MMRFKDIIGQDMIKEHLQGALASGKTSHAYIINGEKNSGKEFIAKIFAMALQCENQGNDPCCECVACKQVESKNHPDVIRSDQIADESIAKQIEAYEERLSGSLNGEKLQVAAERYLSAHRSGN